MENRVKKCRDLLIESGISEEKINDIIKKLKEMGYFIAPASSKYHGAYEGGLFDHSYKVTLELLNLTKKLNLKWKYDISPYIVGLFHDLCKCDQYIFDIETNSYVYNPEITLNGHGEKSVILAQTLINLTEEEILCIRWHMGAYDTKENWKLLNLAIEEYPNILYTHTADMIASVVKGI